MDVSLVAGVVFCTLYLQPLSEFTCTQTQTSVCSAIRAKMQSKPYTQMELIRFHRLQNTHASLLNNHARGSTPGEEMYVEIAYTRHANFQQFP